MRITVVLFLALMLACFPVRNEASRTVDTSLFIKCENRNWSRVEVFVVTPGSGAFRIDRIESMSTGFALVPEISFAGRKTIRLLVITNWGERFLTKAIQVRGGMRVKLVVQNQLHLSTWSVSRRRDRSGAALHHNYRRR